MRVLVGEHSCSGRRIKARGDRERVVRNLPKVVVHGVGTGSAGVEHGVVGADIRSVGWIVRAADKNDYVVNGARFGSALNELGVCWRALRQYFTALGGQHGHRLFAAFAGQLSFLGFNGQILFHS